MSALPVPGVVRGIYPERRTDGPRPRGFGGTLEFFDRGRPYRELAAAARRQADDWRRRTGEDHSAALGALRGRLRREGFTPGALAEALGCAADAGRRVLGLDLYDTQLFAAAVLLDGKLAEMATGEGKTCAAGAAAAVAALAGVPVHVVTANDYLATRDAAALGPLFEALGMTVDAVEAGMPPERRRAAYGAQIVYCTARELAFDYLRDGLIPGGRRGELSRRAAALNGTAPPAPLLRGLCMAILDEADSILLDEATMPLVLSREDADPTHRALVWQALAVARELADGGDFSIRTGERIAELTAAGRARVERLAATLDGPWRSRRRREELVATALAALHAYRRDRDYLVRDGRVEIIDAVSGRAAPGRVWSRGLHGLIELKEGCRLSPDTRTVAQITYQRFFPRYLRLAGMSGTLREARHELRRTYGLPVVEVPLRNPCRRVRLPPRLFADSAALWTAVAARVGALRASGRPVLVGTDSVADSEALSARLLAAGVPHSVLNARHHRSEAEIVARAGVAAAVTVATNMAGRGTDIVLGPGVAAAGGLHVLSCQHNGARRIDRQLAGRCARQGDPGSVETWLALDGPRLAPLGRSGLVRAVRYLLGRRALDAPRWLLRLLAAVPQLLAEGREAGQRRQLLRQDRDWARRALFAPPPE